MQTIVASFDKQFILLKAFAVSLEDYYLLKTL